MVAKQPHGFSDLSSVALKFEHQILSKDNTSGYTGVSKTRNKWVARLNHKGKIVLSQFCDTIEEAVATRAAKIQEIRTNQETL